MSHKASKKSKAWAARRPVPCCELGVLHAFGPGVLFSTNHQLQFVSSDERRIRVPLRSLRLVCLYGPVRVTAGAIRLVTDAGSALAYLSASGLKTNGVLQPASDAWKGRRYRQYLAVQDRAWMLDQARLLVAEKIESMEAAAVSVRSQGRAGQVVRNLIRDLPEMRSKVAEAADHAMLRGLEGNAAKRWFEAFDSLLPEGWSLPGRHKRPPTDPVNALLSLGYTLLSHRVHAACSAWGLDPALGVYHELRPGRSSLACDLMEPFRVVAVDRLILRMLSMNLFSADDFVITTEGEYCVRLIEEAVKRWLSDLEMHLHSSDNSHPSLQVRLIDRVRLFAEALPDCKRDWPNSIEPMELGMDSECSPPPERNVESQE